MLEKVFNSHDKWINTTLKFGCTKYEAAHFYKTVKTSAT